MTRKHTPAGRRSAGERRVLLLGSDDRLLLSAFQSVSSKQAVWVLAPEGSAAGDALAQSRHCRGVERAATGRGPFTRGQIEAVAVRIDATHIVPVTCRDSIAVGPQVGWGCRIYPFATAEVVEQLHNKWAFAALLRAVGVPTPDTILVADEDEARQAAAELGGDLLVKPVDQEGGTGVFRCHDATDFERALAGWPHWPRIVQRFVPGTDRDVSVLVCDGDVVAAAVQDRYLAHGLRFVDDPVALELAAAIVGAAGYSGLAHLDMRRRADGAIEVIECNPRMYATMHLAAYAGVEFVSLGTDAADGWRPARPVLARPGVVVPPRDVKAMIRNPGAFSIGTARAFLAAARDLRFALQRSRVADWGQRQ